ncbi:MAG: 4Fe-4S binding protein [Thermoanaerobaculia bacterium]
MSGVTKWTRWRRAVQIAIALFYLALPLLAVVQFPHVAGTLAALQVGPVDLVEPAAGLSGALAARRVTLTLTLGMLPVILLALTLGPVFCSWVCPWGLLSEGIDTLRGKITKRAWKDESFVAARRPRAWILGVILVAGAALGVPLAAILSAPRLITTLPLEMIFLGIVSPVTGGLVLAILLLELFGPRRFWCRIGCPVGAVWSYLRTPRTLTVRYDESTCVCDSPIICHSDCPWGVDPRRMRNFDACTNCMKCVQYCPGGALSAGFGRRPDTCATKDPLVASSPRRGRESFGRGDARRESGDYGAA